MSDDPLATAVTALIAVIEQMTQTQGIVLAEVKRLGERERELSEDVAELGLRVTTATATAAAGHSLRVVGADSFRNLDELAATLRAEFAAEAATITQRIDDVHEKTLRGLTALIERKPA